MQRIGVDIDDVLLELAQGFIAFHNEEYGTQLVFEQFISYYLPKVIGGTFEEAFAKLERFYQTPCFHNLKPVPGSLDGVMRLQKKAALSIITSRPPELFEVTHTQLRKYHPGQFPMVHFARNPYIGTHSPTKKELCTRLGITQLIEDSLEQAKECAAAGINIYLFDKPWNQSQEEIPRVMRVTGWHDAYLFQ